MRLLVLVLLLLASRADGSPHQRKSFTQSIKDVSYTCGTRPLDISTKIIEGKDAELGSNPWQANLLRNGRHVCGGTILSEYWILTAAHCYNGTYIYDVVAGDRDQRKFELNDQKFNVEKFILHEKYKNVKKYDIALLKIKAKNGRGMKFNNYVQPACLPDANTKLEPGQKFTISGWGWINPNNDSAIILQETQVTLSSDKTICSHEYYDPSTMLCAPKAQRSTCKGDSGGPLIAKINGVYQVFGVTSYGSKVFCELPKGSYFTKVQAYLDWILSTISNNSKNKEEKFLPPRPYD